MKKISLAAIFAVMLSAGFTLQSKAQTRTVSIENYSTPTAKAVITETPIYNKAGKLIYTVKRYEATTLPKEISRLVRNEFVDYDIAGVEEVVLPSDDNSIYLVHIVNDKKIKTVRVYNGESEVINEYKKG